MKRTMIATLLTVLGTGAARADDLAWLDAYNVVWTAPSANSGESMPVGGHDIGLNVWVEDGDVLFYIGQAGCRDENGALLKHGRVRLSLEPNPFLGGDSFRQELKLRESCIEISGQADGAPKTTVRVWVEVGRPVVHVEVDAEAPVEARATFEKWRYRDIELLQSNNKHAQRGMAMMTRDHYPGKVWLYSDTVQSEPEHVFWYHRMRNDKGVFEESVRQQGLEAVRDELYDPLTDLTFGGMLEGDNLRFDGRTEGVYAQTSFRGWRYASAEPDRSHRIRVLCHIDQTDTIEQWKRQLQALAAAEHPTRDEAWQENRDWWGSFWGRSHIVVNPGAGSGDRPWQVGRNYNLARYMLACNVAGREPTMFNGGLFTYDPLYIGGPAARSGTDAIDQGWTPDHRQWGAGFTAQNQRLMYWPMLRSGDFDVMRPGLDFYRLGLDSAAARVKEYWGHEGACFVEQISAQALPGLAMWGFKEGGGRGRPGNLEHGVQVNMATRYLYQAQLEFAYMALQYRRYSGDDLRPYLPFIDAAVRFYDEHYRMRKRERDGEELDEDGHIVITPSIASESYGQGGRAVNPADAVAGLHAVLEGLLGLSDELVPAAKKADYAAMLSRMPPIPVAEMDGQTVFAPAANLEIGSSANETPELYRVFPFNRAGLGLGDVDMARRTWERAPRAARGFISWHQGGIFTARLGLTEEAAGYAVRKLGDTGRRFPTFWGPGHDWVPDHNWGGSGMIGLQEMLMQSPDGKIWLLPAWPEDWDVDFKLHAPQQTVVEGSVRDGKLVSWNVTPEARKGDVKIVGAKE